MEIRFAYVTFPDRATARKIGRQLVEDRLVACVNIVSDMESIFPWDGQIETGNEVACILKTSPQKWAPCCERLEELHPYDTPCIMGWDIAAANHSYSKWLTEWLEGNQP